MSNIVNRMELNEAIEIHGPTGEVECRGHGCFVIGGKVIHATVSHPTSI